MSKKVLLVAPLLVSVLLCMFVNGKDSFANLLFSLHLGRGSDTKAIAETVKKYNSATAGIYATGGVRDQLGLLPASDLQKRRIFQDVSMLGADGFLMIFDKDSFKQEEIVFLHRHAAVAVTHEVWAISLQNEVTRKPVFNVKAVDIKARYLLFRQPNGWQVQVMEVFPAAEPVPPFSTDPVI